MLKMSGILDKPFAQKSEITMTSRNTTIDLIAHRGLWLQPHEKNSVAAFEASLSAGFGIETDVRDLGSQLVISHDIPNAQCQTLESFLDLYNRSGAGTTLAINIKSDGLAQELHSWLRKFSVANYFVFDMSVPDSLHYTKLGMPLFARRSEYEPESKQLELAQGIWLDGFHSEWFNANDWANYLALGKSVSIVSPELHKRPHQQLWNDLYEWLTTNQASLPNTARLMLCTDFPQQFREMICQ
jgi:hypothetical protein